ncbi:MULTISPECIES: bacterio-opsin activator domain-containing protein [Halorussus]|uniref:bacterio-opsin activator domain-containing protein n=1 Tax=Halorussus TaxID=1070314 RepID=UPI0020A13A00|nr:bacterio-opsin activator domain-containing protein [Halorussus vallis]USZ75808.1 PAS domain S-box protein [Halorussus vallis]
MDTTREPSDGGLRVLLVGPEPWRERARRELAGRETTATRSVGGFERAVRTLTDPTEEFDCAVSAHRLDGGTGLELLDELRSRGVQTAFVLAPEDGNESLAGEAVAAGVDAYAPTGGDAEADLANRCRAAVRKRRDDRHRREKARQFEAFFGDPDRFVAVLDADGTVVRANEAALGHLELDRSDVVGKRFWGLPWAEDEGSGRSLDRAIRRAADGEYGSFEAGLADAGRERRFEFSVRPVGFADGPDRIVVEGHEVDERVRLEAELRESEELHRVTLNNMTDTVLVTDDDGEFTYVCPNVHFIFGYTAEEIREFGTIDALLGDDLFDRERLESERTLTNIECTATDQAGREHTLLVNVRTVSIQGGTTLYSCRDITKRKQRERALTQLHRTSRSLLYAESADEIAERVVADAESVLPTGAAVYRFDAEANALVPAAASEAFRSTVGDPAERRLDRATTVSRAFIEDETKTRSDADLAGGADREDPLASLDGYVAVPLADHGVFVVAADEAFDEVGEEVAELLAATAEAAFDRVEREDELRERDRRLQRQNRRLSQLNQVNAFIREIDQALVGAETREKVERAVCDRLTTDDRFAFAWIGETAPADGSLRPRAWAGDDRGYLDGVSLGPGGDDASVEPTVRAALDREAALVSNVADDLRAGPWRAEAVSRDFQSVLAIPLAYDDVLFGTLTVYAARPDAFDGMVRSVLCELGDTVASAINAVQRKEALRSDTVVELEYEVSDRSAVLSRLAGETGASIRLAGDVASDDGTTFVLAEVEGAAPDAVVDAAEGFVGISEAKPIRGAEETGFFGLRVREDFVARVLADHGAVLRRLRATPAGLSLTVDVPDSVTVRSIDEVLSNTYDGAKLIAQREQTRGLPTRERRAGLLDDLTERQLEVAQIAYHSGFFDAQREVTGRDVASMLDISHTAFYDHVRRIQRKLFASLFEESPNAVTVE